MVCKTRTGFTIVELVIVIAVIAILAAVLIPTFSSIIGKARESSAIQTVHSAVKTFVSSGGSVEPGTFVYVEYREDGELYQFRFDGHETTRVPKDEVLDFDVSTTKYPFAAVYTLNPAKNGDFDPVKHYNYVFCAGTTYYICYSSGTVADGVSFFVPADPSSEVFVLIKSAGNWELVSLWKEESMENGESLICGYPEPEEEDDDPISAAVLMRYFLSDLLPIMSSSQDPGSEEYFLNGVTEITRAMLAGYTAITTITIPASVTSVADDAFGGLPNLCSIEVDPANPYFTSLDGVLFSKDGKTLIRYPRAKSGDYAIPNGVTGIASNSFGQCHGITSLTITASVCETIDRNNYINNSALTEINVEKNNPIYRSEDGVLFSKDGSVLYFYPRGKNGSDFAVPSGVTLIDSSAFFNSRLSHITIPKSVTEIGSSVFTSTARLNTITLEDGNANYVMSNGALFTADMTKLIRCTRSVAGDYTVPSTVKSFDTGAFFYCSSLTSVALPEGVVSIPGYLFTGCTKLISVSLPLSLRTVGRSVFWNCTSLTEVTIPNGVAALSEDFFSFCPALNAVTLPSSIKVISAGAFANCTALHDVYYGGTLSQWGTISVLKDNELLAAAALHCADD